MLNERFWSKVNKNAPNGCWEWTAYRSPKGYGRFQTGTLEGPRFAHRLSYEDAKGRIPKGRFVCHSCDNPACVNPAHLWLGDNKANMADCRKKGRYYGSGPARPRGESHGKSKFDSDTVTAIRRAYINGESRASITTRFSIKPSFLDDVVSGRVWRHLLGQEGSPTLAELQSAKRTAPAAKLTREVATEIRRRLSNGETGKALASAYGIHAATVSDIKRGKIWR